MIRSDVISIWMVKCEKKQKDLCQVKRICKYRMQVDLFWDLFGVLVSSTCVLSSSVKTEEARSRIK